MTNPIKGALRTFLRKKRELDEKAEKGPYGYIEEYASLRQKSQQYKDNGERNTAWGEKPFNYRKNRYKDILPYDHTRVKLNMINEMTGTDYINANYIMGVGERATYVAAQGPLPNTVCDFWRMLWEQKTKVVIMACSEYEGDPPKHKCEKYWPDDVGQEMKFDKISVSLEKLIKPEFQDYTVRFLRVECNQEVHKLHQLHYVGWPDHGVPDSVTPIIDMIAQGRNYQQHEQEDMPPMVIHCSAGCGRTGTIIAIDYIWSLLKAGKMTSDFNLYDIVDDLRNQRTAMVQSTEQYKFVHESVAELFERHLDMMEKHAYENVELGNRANITKKQMDDRQDDYDDVTIKEDADTPVSIGSSNISRQIRQTVAKFNNLSTTVQKSPAKRPVVDIKPKKDTLPRAVPGPKPQLPTRPPTTKTTLPQRSSLESTGPTSPTIANLKAMFDKNTEEKTPVPPKPKPSHRTSCASSTKEMDFSEDLISFDTYSQASDLSAEVPQVPSKLEPSPPPNRPSIDVPSSRPSIDVPPSRPSIDVPPSRPSIDVPASPQVLFLEGATRTSVNDDTEEADYATVYTEEEKGIPKPPELQADYAYADEFSTNKWTLQKYALQGAAERQETYSEVSIREPTPPGRSRPHVQQQDYEVVTLDGSRPMLEEPRDKDFYDSQYDSDDEEAPELPEKMPNINHVTVPQFKPGSGVGPPSILEKIKRKLKKQDIEPARPYTGETPTIIQNDQNINFPNRVATPMGPRPNPFQSSVHRHS